MTSEGELWKRQRYMMQPAFHRRVITEFSKLIDACNERFIAKWEAQAARGELVNVTDDMSELTLEIVLLSIFGTDLERLEKDFGSNPFDIVTKETARDLKFAYKFRQLAKLVGALAQRRRDEKSEHFDFLQMMMDARDKETGAPMSERELVDEAMTLIVAGHETTASGLNWIWYLLSQNPEAEALLHAEIDASDEKREPALADMEQLSYTKNVVDEALRLYPPGWLLSRRTIEPRRALGLRPAPPAPTCCSAPIYCTGTRATGRNRTLSGPSDSMRRTKANVRDSPTCRLPRARGTA